MTDEQRKATGICLILFNIFRIFLSSLPINHYLQNLIKVYTQNQGTDGLVVTEVDPQDGNPLNSLTSIGGLHSAVNEYQGLNHGECERGYALYSFII